MAHGSSTLPPKAADIPVFVKYFPMAMVLLDREGRPVFTNECFNRDFGMEVMEIPVVRELAQTMTPGWKSVDIVVAGKEKVTFVRVLEIGATVMMMFDDALDRQLRDELEELHHQIVRLEHLCAVDVLTEIWNRAHFDKMIALETGRSKRLKQPVSLIIVDIDYFKRINDSHGHQVGDSLLRELVKVIQTSMRSTDMLFRWGGEEFAVLAIATGHRAAVLLAERICAGVAAHRFAEVGKITVSLGVAEHVGDETSTQWFQRADEALYLAKEGGRNRVYADNRGNSDQWAAEKGPSVIRLEWKEAYQSGNRIIDQEHRKLFEVGNEMLDAAFQAESEPEAFRLLLDRLVRDIQKHFLDEERILAESGYADLEAHKTMHHALSKHAEKLQSDVKKGRVTLGSLVDFMANSVIARHIFKEDHKYFHLFEKGGDNAGADERLD